MLDIPQFSGQYAVIRDQKQAVRSHCTDGRSDSFGALGVKKSDVFVRFCSQPEISHKINQGDRLISDPLAFLQIVLMSIVYARMSTSGCFHRRIRHRHDDRGHRRHHALRADVPH